MTDFSTWREYKNLSGAVIGIQSPDGREAKLLVDAEVAAWIAAGGTPLPAVAPTLGDVKAMLERKVEEYIQAKMSARGFNTADSLPKYQNLTDAQIAACPVAQQAAITGFRADAQAGAVWIAQLWAVCYTSQSNATPNTTWEQLFALLPTAPW